MRYKNAILIPTFIVISLIIRLSLMPISVHSDLFSINNYPPLLVHQNVWDVYSYIDRTKPSLFFYPPLSYYLIGTFQYFDQFISDSFFNWMDAQRTLYEQGFKGQAAQYIIATPNPHIFRDLFLAKIPYLVFDIFSLIILWQFIKKKIINKWALALWLFNPVLLYNSYIFGHLDIIPIFFILSAFYFLTKNRIAASVFLLGVAGAFKLYPFMLVPLVIIIFRKSLIDWVRLGTIAILPLFISLLPTIINNPQLALSAFTVKLFNAYHTDVSGWEYYSDLIKYLIIIISYLVLSFLAWKVKIRDKFKLAVGVSLISILLLLNFVYRVHFHYLLWIAPYIILWFKNIKTATFIVLIQAISFASYKILANQLQLGLFAPINPYYFSNLPTFNEIINQLIPYRIISSLGFLVFSILSLAIVANVLFRIIFQEEVSLSNRR